MAREGRSLAETPTWAFATVICAMVSFSYLVQISMKQCGKWLDRTRRKSLFAALEKIKEELILFGVLSLLMGHWIVVVAKICIKASALSSRFFPCAAADEAELDSMSDSLNDTSRFAKRFKVHDYCPEGHESFASYESLEQLHRFVFVLAVTHISYSFVSIVLSMLKIYSWRAWENEAKAVGDEDTHDNPQALAGCPKLTRMSTFIDHQALHPWSQHHLLVWLLCFSRQFWSSINRSDYMALRLGFITTHQLPLSYDFHNYMLRSLEEEFRDIVGISIPLWIYTICCIFLDFHGSNIYFWLSFLPAILILVIGTKLHRVVVKLAVEIMGNYSTMEVRQFKLRDELFWFRKPRLLLNLIQLISFQNAFEMANFLWSLWEIKGPSCFMDNRRFLVIRLSFGVVSQFWCSFITFPLYVIITQMGSRFKRTVVAENVRKSLSGWHRRVKAKHGSPAATTPSDSTATPTTTATTSSEGSSSRALPGRTGEDETAMEMEDDVSPFPPFGHALNDNEIRHRSVYGTDHATSD